MNDEMICINSELYHHGVKGMKWGVRKKRSISNRKMFEKKPKVDPNPEVTKRKQQLKNVRSMSDDDIKRNIQRLQQEKQYKDLLKADLYETRSENRKRLDAVMNTVVTPALREASKSAVQTYAKNLLTYTAETAIDKYIGEKNSDLAAALKKSG